MLRSICMFCVVFGSSTAFADGDALTSTWSDAVLDRPLTLPAAKMAVYGDADVFKFNNAGFSATSEVVHGGIGYGVNDMVTIGVDYAFNVHASSSFTIMGMTTDSSDTFPGDGRGPIIPHVSLRLLHGQLSVAVSGGLIANLAGEQSQDAMGNTTYSTTYSVIAGAVVKYNLAPNVALYTGAPLGGGVIGFAGSPFGPGPLGNQLEISLSKNAAGNRGPTTLALPVGVGLQLTPQFFAFGQTTIMAAYLANGPMGGDNPAFIGSDSDKGGLGIPFVAGAFFTLNRQLELGGTLSFPDLTHAGDLYLFGLAVRLYSGG